MSSRLIRRTRSVRGSSPKAPVPAPIIGNYFEFWLPIGARRPKPNLPELVPKKKSGASASASAPSPTTPPPPSDTPFQFLKAHFEPTKTSPFGAKSTFGTKGDGYKAISRVQFIRAGVELGYGPRKTWNSAFAFSGTAGPELARHLLLRLQSIMSCLEQSTDGSWKPRKFYDKIEASEKVAISFVLGSIFSFHAADMWLSAAGDGLQLFLHTGLYTKAIVDSEERVKYSSSTKQRPDFIVLSQQGHWSLFESKGGTWNKKWGQLYKGLRQLQGGPSIGWESDATLVEPQACVCTYTEVDTAKPLKTTAIDPPEDDFPTFPDAGEPNSEVTKLVFVKGVIQLMVILQAIDQYRAMAADAVDDGSSEPKPNETWIATETRRFEGLLVGIPVGHLRLEPKIRATLACYFIVQEFVEERRFSKPSRFNYEREQLGDAVVNRIEKLESSDEAIQQARLLASKLNNVRDGKERVFLADDSIFKDCANYLGIEELAETLMGDIREMRSIFELLNSPNFERVVTSGGLLLLEGAHHNRREEQS